MAVPHHFLPEIVTLVFHYLPKKDIKSARLVCRLFDRFASPFLIDRAYIAPLSSSIDRFKEICRHPVFSQSVREVVYVGALYEARWFHIRQKYQQAVESKWRERDGEVEEADFEWGPLPKWKLPEWVTSEFVDRCYGTYKQHDRDQQAMIAAGEDLAALCVGLPLLVNLEAVEFSDWTPPNGYLPGCAAEMILGPSSWNEYHLLGQSRQHGLVVLVRALSYTGARVREMRIKPRCDIGEMPYGMPSSLLGFQERDLNHAQNAFRWIKKVDLEITTDYISFHAWNLAIVLCEAEGLEDLGICIHNGNRNSRSNIVFVAIRDMRWKRLRKLRLEGIDITEKGFLKFLRGHVGSLRRLDLCNVSSSAGTWVDITVGMAGCLNLEEFSLAYAYDIEGAYCHDDGDFNDQVTDFVLGRIPNPWPGYFHKQDLRDLLGEDTE